MANERDRPYSQFNFQVAIVGTIAGTDVKAGFQEVSGLGTEIHIAEYRAGNWTDNSAIKISGSYKLTDVTMKRGVIGELATLHSWLVNVRDGTDDRRTITINLMAEDRTTVAQTWTLSNAKPMKYTGPSLTGKGTDVAIEEVVFCYEHMDIS